MPRIDGEFVDAAQNAGKSHKLAKCEHIMAEFRLSLGDARLARR